MSAVEAELLSGSVDASRPDSLRTARVSAMLSGAQQLQIDTSRSSDHNGASVAMPEVSSDSDNEEERAWWAKFDKGNSLLVFASDNALRVRITRIVDHDIFSNGVLSLIVINTVLHPSTPLIVLSHPRYLRCILTPSLPLTLLLSHS